PSAPNLGFMPGDFFDRPADVDRAGASTIGGAPWNRAIERPIDLEDAGAIAESAEAPNVSRRERGARDLDELPRPDLEAHCAKRQRGCAAWRARQSWIRAVDFGEGRGGPSGRRFEQSLIRRGVGAEACCSGLDGALQDRRGAVVERMGQCKRWVDPLQTVLRE